MYVSAAIVLLTFMAGFTPLVHSRDQVQKMKLRYSSAYRVELEDNAAGAQKIELKDDKISLLGAIYYLDESFAALKDCLLFQKNPTTKSSRLYFREVAIGEECLTSKFVKNNFVFENVYNLALDFSKAERLITFYIDTLDLKIKLFNIRENKKYELLNSSALETQVPGVRISFTPKSENSKKLEINEICFDVDDNCNVTVNKDCSLCPNGAYDVIASGCGQYYRSYCGDRDCGAKGEPACVRGRSASNFKLNYCIPDSPIGFCEKPNRVFCENGELICN